ncbi:hypothetical protein OAL23_01355, partial [bacterium]|nr:hypothetical protein [bacterium]
MDFWDILLVLVAIGASTGFIFSAKLRHSSRWSATVTPLASIMGSGFLVSAPLLGGIVGSKAVFFMAALLLLAFLVGAALRYNIRYFELIEHEKGGVQTVALISRFVL